MSRGARIVAIALAAAAGLAVGGVGTVWWLFERALAPARADAAPVVFTVPRGASLTAIARDLEERELIRSARAFAWLARLRGRAQDLHAGEYDVSASEPARRILERLASGRVKTYEVVLPEGLRADEVATRLAEAGLVERDAFLAFALDPAAPDALGVAGPTLEGYLFPETYRLPRGLGVRAVAAALVEQFLAVWTDLAPQAEGRGLDMRETVTLASIVEKETGVPAERPLIAGVFWNRLERGMRLESDPTVIYGIADFDGNLKRVHLENAGNAYNTYQIAGLPPGPIANPGEAALRAVVQPAETEYLFFVSRNDGSHVFSRTYREHVNAVNRFQRSGSSAKPRLPD